MLIHPAVNIITGYIYTYIYIYIYIYICVHTSNIYIYCLYIPTVHYGVLIARMLEVVYQLYLLWSTERLNVLEGI
jgi:hypothetical protein